VDAPIAATDHGGNLAESHLRAVGRVQR
jgi:hypothetical protein